MSLDIERESVEELPEAGAERERSRVDTFLTEMVGKQPEAVAETVKGIAAELSEQTGSPIDHVALLGDLERGMGTGLEHVDDAASRRAASVIEGEELNPDSQLWRENPDAQSMLGHAAREHREALRSVLCEVLAAEQAAK